MLGRQLMSETNPSTTQRWKCTCAYDGTSFEGWQSQAGGTAVQDTIERRLAEIFGRLVRIHGSGRTDAGVHALAQVFHFDADWTHGADKLVAAFRVGLPASVQVARVEPVSPTFHARFSAIGKRYVYRLHVGDPDPFNRPFCWSVSRPLDRGAMSAAAARLCGRHDFRAFTALNGPEREDTVRELRRLAVRGVGRRIVITAEADGFLYKMVRSLVGVLVAVGEGRMTVSQVGEVLDGRRRTRLVQTAPPQGLFLAEVFYP